jgi:Amt family ammonium transporter
MFVVYFPLAHMVWGIDGFMNGVWNADAGHQGDRLRRRHRGAHVLRLVGAHPLPDPRPRLGFGKSRCPAQHGALHGRHRHALGRLVRLQRRQRGRADGIAANAFMTTTLATAVASFTWADDRIIPRQAEHPRLLLGAVAGLVVITPACGFRDATGAVIIGLAAGIVPWFFCYKVKGWFGYDDALDTFGVHAVGGTWAR